MTSHRLIRGPVPLAILVMATFALSVPTTARAVYYYETVEPPGGEWMYTSIALGPDGMPRISYMSYYSQQIKFAVKRGTCWYTEVVSTLTSRSVTTDLALEADGTAHVVYDDGAPGHVYHAYKSQGAWIVEMIDEGGDPSIALDAQGRAHVAYSKILSEQHPQSELHYAVRTGPSQWQIEWVGPDMWGGQGGENDIALDAEGNPHIVYMDYTFDDLRYVEKRDGLWHDGLVHEGFAGNMHSSIALDSQGEPHVAFHYVGTGRITYAHRVDGVWTTEQPRPVGEHHGYPSIAMDAQDRPHIAYLNNGLEYVVKNGGVWQVTVVDWGWDRGWYAGLALDAEGRPHISYAGQGEVRYHELATTPTICTPPGSDRFDGTVLNLSQWVVSSPLNGSTVTQNETLNVTSDGTAGRFAFTPALIGPGAGVAARCLLSGDLDIQVDFTDFAGPSVNHTQAFFGIYQDQTHQLHIKRLLGATVNGIQSGWYGAAGGVTHYSGSSGKFRITRTGSTLTTYYDVGYGWQVQMQPTAMFSGDVYVSLMLLAPGGQTSSVSWDNYLVNKGTVVCPTGTISGTVTATCAGSTAPAAGVPVHLLQAGAEVSATATGADGAYLFEDVSLGTYTVRITPPQGYGTGTDHQIVSLANPGETATADFGLTCLLASLEVTVTGACHGVAEPMYGVTVDAYSVGEGGEEVLVGTAATDEGGLVRFDDVALGDYRVLIVTPLGYAADPASQAVTVDVPGGVTSVAFEPACRAIAAEPRSMGYWKHQVNVYLSGKGKAQETLADLLSYIDLMIEHFNENVVNPVVVYVPAGGDVNDELLQLCQLLTVNRGATNLDRAKRQLLALLLNVVSEKIAQTGAISEDGRTVSQAITYCHSLITDGDPGNDATAGEIADLVNNGVPVPEGMIPASTPVISYRLAPNGLPLRLEMSPVRPNPSRGVFCAAVVLPSGGPVSLELMDVAGRRVWREEKASLGPGRHIWWVNPGVSLPAGVYRLRLMLDGTSVTRSVVRVR